MSSGVDAGEIGLGQNLMLAVDMVYSAQTGNEKERDPQLFEV